MTNRAVMLALLVGCTTGCYHVRLDPISPVAAERLSLAADVDVPAATASATYDVHSAMAGAANTWTLDVGAAIVQYAHAYLGPAFASGHDATVRVELTSFAVQDFEAHAELRFSVLRGGATVADKSYRCKGEGYAARVVWGGAFAMKSSMRQTTDEALRDCFSRFLADARVEHATWAATGAPPVVGSSSR